MWQKLPFVEFTQVFGICTIGDACATDIDTFDGSLEILHQDGAGTLIVAQSSLIVQFCTRMVQTHKVAQASLLVLPFHSERSEESILNNYGFLAMLGMTKK